MFLYTCFLLFTIAQQKQSVCEHHQVVILCNSSESGHVIKSTKLIGWPGFSSERLRKEIDVSQCLCWFSLYTLDVNARVSFERLCDWMYAYAGACVKEKVYFGLKRSNDKVNCYSAMCGNTQNVTHLYNIMDCVLTFTIKHKRSERAEGR